MRSSRLHRAIRSRTPRESWQSPHTPSLAAGISGQAGGQRLHHHLSSISSSRSSSSNSISSLKSTSSGTCTLKCRPPRSNSTSLCLARASAIACRRAAASSRLSRSLSVISNRSLILTSLLSGLRTYSGGPRRYVPARQCRLGCLRELLPRAKPRVLTGDVHPQPVAPLGDDMAAECVRHHTEWVKCRRPLVAERRLQIVDCCPG